MGYDFLADLALEEKEEMIDQVVNQQGKYAILKKADWTTMAQVLATGARFEDENFPRTQANKQQVSLKELMKDGRPEKKRNNTIELSAIGGYPKLVSSRSTFQPDAPLDIASFCAPDEKTCLEGLPDGSCLVKIEVKLLRPFASRDDRPFYPHENPLKREWVFQNPCLSAAGVKGLLRWAWRMRFAEEEKKMLSVEETIFGPRNEGLKDGEGQAGCLYLWPVFWKGKVGLEVINPHDRQSGAGNNPIKYEVMKTGATSTLWFLFLNRRMQESREFVRNTVAPLLESLELLISASGISAKRSADWGSVAVTAARASIQGLAQPAAREETPAPAAEIDIWAEVMDSGGDLLPWDQEGIFTAKRLALLTGKSEKKVRGDNRADALEIVNKKFAEYKAKKQADASRPAELKTPVPVPVTRNFTGGNGINELIEWLATVVPQEDRP